MPVVKGTTIISNEVVAVRGMAKQGPMVRMMASASTMANLGGDAVGQVFESAG